MENMRTDLSMQGVKEIANKVCKITGCSCKQNGMKIQAFLFAKG